MWVGIGGKWRLGQGWGVFWLGFAAAQGVSVDTLLPPGVERWSLPVGWLLRVELVPPVPFRYDTAAHELSWPAQSDTVRLRLWMYPLPQAPPRYQPLPWQALERWDSLNQYTTPPPVYAQTDTFTPKLNRSGSLVRSLTVGTGQNATLNSAFRLNLEGAIAPDVYLLAALTDENLPFQTAATQSIADFDRVNIGLRWKESQLLLGDLELRQSGTTFANFYRNVLGVELRAPFGRHKTRVAFAEAKGQFHTNSFMGQEGRQGPYPLTGKNGERFIPILAGSEKVYINGVLMQRGQDRDYVIDYTVGEITFTPRVPITAATRIVVDFEYADRSYGRSFLWAEENWQSERLQLQVSYFRQADNPRRPLDFSLSSEEEAFLAALPPGQRVGLLPGVDTLPYEAGAIRYAAKDTLWNGQLRSYFVLSQDPAEALYQVSFVYVGPGRGEYVREPSSLNGNVFRWAGPGAGDYIVGRAVPLPTSVEVLSLRHRLFLTKRLSWEGELDGSRTSENRFARRYAQDIATRQTLRWQLGTDTSTWQALPELSLQYVGARYQNADRVYEREYGRLWNFNDLGARAVERLAETRLPLLWRKRHKWTPHLGLRSWGDSLQTTRYALAWEGLDTTRGLGGQYLLEYLRSADAQTADRWLRQTGRIFYSWRRWRVGSALWTERRSGSRVDSAQFRFYEYTPFVGYRGERLSAQVSFQLRREWQALPSERPIREGLRFSALMPQLEFTYQGVRLRFATTTAYRLFTPGDTAFGLSPVRTLLSQNTFQLQARPWEVEGSYQLSAEQTPQRQLLFVAVNPGQGTHEWRDLNGDGLQQLEEFIPAVNPLLANYIRVQRATGRFIPTVGLISALAVRWQPQKRLRWIGYQVNTRLEQRQSAPDNRFVRYLPSSPPTDTTFLQWSLLHRQDLFLFRSATRGDQTFSFQYQLTQLVPLSGLQRQASRTYSSRSRLSLSRSLGAEGLLSYLLKESQAPQQPELIYAYAGWEVSPQLIYQPSGRWRTAIGVVYRLRQIRLPSATRLQGVKLPIEQRWSWKAGAFVGMRLEPTWYRVSQPLSPVLAFDLMEGLQVGRNLFTSLTLNFPVSRFVELSLLYEGRFTSREPLHSARMQARANF